MCCWELLLVTWHIPPLVETQLVGLLLLGLLVAAAVLPHVAETVTTRGLTCYHVWVGTHPSVVAATATGGRSAFLWLAFLGAAAGQTEVPTVAKIVATHGLVDPHHWPSPLVGWELWGWLVAAHGVTTRVCVCVWVCGCAGVCV